MFKVRFIRKKCYQKILRFLDTSLQIHYLLIKYLNYYKYLCIKLDIKKYNYLDINLIIPKYFKV